MRSIVSWRRNASPNGGVSHDRLVAQDIWIQWLLKGRFGGDPERMKKMFDWLYPVRDKVLSHINLEVEETLLDVGCGDGLIAFGALEKFETCRVIFSDISEDLLIMSRGWRNR